MDSERDIASRTCLSGKTIAVDLTPLLPGGENGGAKWMTLELISALARLLPDTSFVLMTAEVSHSELDNMERNYANIQRVCILQNSTASPADFMISTAEASKQAKPIEQAKALAGQILPEGLKSRLKAMLPRFRAWKSESLEKLETTVKRFLPRPVRVMIGRWRGTPAPIAQPPPRTLLGRIAADLLFCPFTAPFYAEPQVPTVSVIYDLQYRVYSQFFTPEESVEREKNFQIACQKADHLVAISEFVRQTVIEAANFSPDRVTAVPIGLLHPSANGKPSEASAHKQLLEKYGVEPGNYVLYPANFWKHKNHAMLLTAFNMYRHTHPQSTLKLLCTGAPGRGAEDFCEQVRRMGLSDWVVYPGFVTSEEYELLLRSAFAMIFPSLYEGFGIPVLEAMSSGVPVLCGNVTSLPEVGGDAVLYFDPRRPMQIVESLMRLSEEPGLRENLIVQGVQRARKFEGADRMAVEYAGVFARTVVNTVGQDASRSR